MHLYLEMPTLNLLVVTSCSDWRFL